MKVLFVCTGNTCRSPMAMGLFEKMAKENGLQNIISDSAGLVAFEGTPTSEYAIEALKQEGIDISNYTSKRVTKELLEGSDLIVGISPYHISAIISAFPELKNKTVLLGNGIDDPYGLSADEYIQTRDEIKSALYDILNIIKRMNNN
jgi:protein-tyrosine-phosphatase